MDCEIYKEKISALQAQLADLKRERDQVPEQEEGAFQCSQLGIGQNKGDDHLPISRRNPKLQNARRLQSPTLVT